ncbi:MAG: DUF4313 domain-containing protein [Oscillospiraceae bacterium]|jgi:hypothetical protein|nr:DUF4313 domain-containing protein [Oscillospiraceae bacterium]
MQKDDKKQMKKNKPIFKYNNPLGISTDVVFVVRTYSNNGNLCVMLEDAETGEFFTDVTKNFEALSEGQAHIKNVDENEGMVQFLIDNDMGFLMGNWIEHYPLFFFHPVKLAEADSGGFAV